MPNEPDRAETGIAGLDEILGGGLPRHRICLVEGDPGAGKTRASTQLRSFAAAPLSSGVAGLDRLLGGGIERGTSTLLTGPAGAGKSIIATQFALAAAERGESAAIFAFDEGSATFFERTRRLGLDIDRHVRSGQLQLQPLEALSGGE